MLPLSLMSILTMPITDPLTRRSYISQKEHGDYQRPGRFWHNPTVWHAQSVKPKARIEH